MQADKGAGVNLEARLTEEMQRVKVEAAESIKAAAAAAAQEAVAKFAEQHFESFQAAMASVSEEVEVRFVLCF
jgi:hypothetical protein